MYLWLWIILLQKRWENLTPNTGKRGEGERLEMVISSHIEVCKWHISNTMNEAVMIVTKMYIYEQQWQMYIYEQLWTKFKNPIPQKPIFVSPWCPLKSGFQIYLVLLCGISLSLPLRIFWQGAKYNWGNSCRIHITS